MSIGGIINRDEKMDSANCRVHYNMSEGRNNVLFGYFVMGIIFLLLRFFYRILPQKKTYENLLQAMINDFVSLFAYMKQIILSHLRTVRAILVMISVLLLLSLLPFKVEILNIICDALSVILYFLLVIVFAPKDDPSRQGFPIEVFGFTYFVILMFYSAGSLVFDIFYTNNFFKEDMWIYGYSITIISYVVCIATLRGFMERKLSNEEIVLLGMIMLTTLEFITYYGIGFFSGMEHYDPASYEENLFGKITNVINQGIYVASQSQILERNDMEVWGNIILNGTDVLTITAVLGYVMQKFIEK